MGLTNHLLTGMILQVLPKTNGFLPPEKMVSELSSSKHPGFQVRTVSLVSGSIYIICWIYPSPRMPSSPPGWWYYIFSHGVPYKPLALFATVNGCGVDPNYVDVQWITLYGTMVRPAGREILQRAAIWCMVLQRYREYTITAYCYMFMHLYYANLFSFEHVCI